MRSVIRLLTGKKWLVILHFTFYILHFTFAERSEAYPGAYNLYRKVFELRGNGEKGPYFLPHRFVIFNSENLILNDTLLLKREIDYRFNFNNGEINFLFSLLPTDKIQITYEILPFPLKSRYQHRSVEQASLPVSVEGQEESLKTFPNTGTDKSANPLEPSQEKQENLTAFPSPLNFGGSKTIGFTIGSGQDLSLEQSLRLNLSGRIAPEVEVNAILSDQNLPIQPEGTTEKLEEIDKMWVEIQGRNLGATLGDYDLNLKGSELAETNRKLEGAKGEVDYDKFSVTLAGAISKGKFASNHFFGEEGKQGPYQLKSENGKYPIIILAGSEKVWLDGKPLVRGENNDYVIEYGDGAVTFTPRHLITSQSRILIDFEYTTERYRRSLFALRSESRFFEKRLSLGMTIFSEKDNPQRPLSFNLTEEGKKVLAETGDEPNKSWISGATFVGQGKGDYTLGQDSVFVYQGKGQGDYLVSFTKVERQDGEYNYDAQLGGYHYAGKGMGDYLPRIFLPLPASEKLFALDTKFQTNTVSAVVEAAQSIFDANALSAKDDEDNSAGAYQVNLGLKYKTFLNGRGEIQGSHRFIDKKFQGIGRLQKLDYERHWGTERQELRGDEKSNEIKGKYFFLRYFAFEGEYGRLSKGEFKSLHQAFQLTTKSERIFTQYRQERVKNQTDSLSSKVREGKRFTDEILFGYNFWQLTPMLRLAWEKDETKSPEFSGWRYFEKGGKIGFTPWQGVALSSEISNRRDKIYQTMEQRWILESRRQTLRGVLSLRRTPAFLLNFEGTHYQCLFERDMPGTNISNDLFSLRLETQPSRATNGVLEYSVTNIQEALFVERFYEVAPKTGNYSQDPQTGRFYPDPEGNYRREIIPQGEVQPLTDLSARVKIYLTPGKFLADSSKNILQYFQSETNLLVREKTKERDKLKVYLLNPKVFQNDTTTIIGETQLEEEITFSPKQKNFSMIVYYFRKDAEDNQYLSRHLERLEEKERLKINSTYSRTGSLEGTFEKKEEIEKSAELGIETEIHILLLGVKIMEKPKQFWQISLKPELKQEKTSQPAFYPQLGTIKLLSYSLTPQLIYFLKEKGRLELETTITQRKIKGEEKTLPIEIGRERPVGLSANWSLNFDYRLSQYVTFSLNYSGQEKPKEKMKHLGRMELKAYF
ncbi:MAG: hypothetical protein AB1393_10220 [Candidatus Edwardsbacteria bacterium]